MIRLAQAEARLASPAGQVFDWVSDLRRFGDWFPGVLGIQAAHAGGEPGLGAHYRESVKLPLRGATEVDIRVCTYEPGAQLVTEGDLAPIWPRMQIDIAADGPDHCRLIWRMDSRSQSPGIRLAAPLLRRVMQRRADGAMRRLRQQFGDG